MRDDCGATKVAGRRACRPEVEGLEARWVTSTLPAPAGAPLAPAIEIQGPDGDGFTPLFGSQGLSGWTIPYDWGQAVVRDGEIRLSGSKRFFLVSPRAYSDFILEGEAWIPPQGDSGIQFRSHYRHDALWGYQAEMSTSPGNRSGGLWQEGKNWLALPSRNGLAQPGRWNQFQIVAIGTHVWIEVNGTLAVSYDKATVSQGYLALQDHGGPGIYRFRNLMVKELAPSS